MHCLVLADLFGRRHWLGFLANLSALGFVFSGLEAKAQVIAQYKVEDLGPDTTGIAMNDKHEVVGNDSMAFFYGASGFKIPAQIQDNAENGSSSIAINSGGAWVGWYLDAGYNNHFFAMTGTAFTDITTVFPVDDNPTISALSDEGKLIANGMSGVYVYDLNTQKLGMLATNPPLVKFEAFHANNKGQYVGTKSVGGKSYACAWSTNKTLTLLHPEYFVDRESRTKANNDLGDVVGSWDISTGKTDGFFIDAINGVVDLLPLEGFQTAEALAINNNKQIVGDCTAAGAQRACLWTTNGVAIDLNNLVTPQVGRTLTTAPSIASDGAILCNGAGADGLPHAYILTPLSASLPQTPDIQNIQSIGGLLKISYKTVAGKLYQPQYRNNLSNNDLLNGWQALGAQQTATNTVMSFTDAPVQSQRFYRVELSQ